MLIHEKVSVELVSFTGCQGEKVKPVYIKLKFCCNSPSSSVPPHLQCRSARGDGGTHNNVSLTWARRGAFVAPSFQLRLSPLSHLSPDSTSILIFYIHPFYYFEDWVEHHCHLLLRGSHIGCETTILAFWELNNKLILH